MKLTLNTVKLGYEYACFAGMTYKGEDVPDVFPVYGNTRLAAKKAMVRQLKKTQTIIKCATLIRNTPKG